MSGPARRADRHYTCRDYRSWPKEELWELIDGVAYAMSPAPGANHQSLVAELRRQIGDQLRGRPCEVHVLPVNVFLPADLAVNEDDVDTVVQPDIFVVCDRSRIRPNGIWGPPDWIVEILSPWTQRKDLAEKFGLYQRAGVREYWTVDPGSRSLTVYVLQQGPGGTGWYGDGWVHLEPAKVACAAVGGLEIDFAKAFASLAP